MIGLIAGLFLGSAFTIIIMSLMVVSKRADESTTTQQYRNEVYYRKYSDQLE